MVRERVDRPEQALFCQNMNQELSYKHISSNHVTFALCSKNKEQALVRAPAPEEVFLEMLGALPLFLAEDRLASLSSLSRP